jgi:hypothetical protein
LEIKRRLKNDKVATVWSCGGRPRSYAVEPGGNRFFQVKRAVAQSGRAQPAIKLIANDVDLQLRRRSDKFWRPLVVRCHFNG